MTEKEYRSHPAVSRSELWRMSESPEKFKYFRDNPPKATPSLTFGQLIHAMILQPDTVHTDFCIELTVNRRTKEGREAYEKWLETVGDKTVISAEMWEKALAMRDALSKNRTATALLDGQHEVPFFWTDEDTGEECKCRADCITQTDSGLIVVDYKSTANAKPHIFNHEIYKYGYHLQAAMYTEGVMKVFELSERPEFIFIAQEKQPPYSVNIMQVTDDVMLHGIDTFREYIGIYHECNETGYWYGYNGPFDEINETFLPGWLTMGEEEE